VQNGVASQPEDSFFNGFQDHRGFRTDPHQVATLNPDPEARSPKFQPAAFPQNNQVPLTKGGLTVDIRPQRGCG
jgi:hypothetical protein